MVTIKLSNKLFYSLITIAAILLISAGVYAVTAGGTENPGHNVQNVGAPVGCTSGEFLQFHDGSGCSTQGASPCWICETPSTTVPSNYVRNVEVIYNTDSLSGEINLGVSCPSGKEVLGGGCMASGCSDEILTSSRPSFLGGDYNGWICGYSLSESCAITTYAICANIS